MAALLSHPGLPASGILPAFVCPGKAVLYVKRAFHIPIIIRFLQNIKDTFLLKLLAKLHRAQIAQSAILTSRERLSELLKLII